MRVPCVGSRMLVQPCERGRRRGHCWRGEVACSTGCGVTPRMAEGGGEGVERDAEGEDGEGNEDADDDLEG